MTDNETLNSLVLAEKYRPNNLDECILPEATLKLVKDAIANNKIPHFLFTGTAGIGKTTLARVIAKTIDADMLFINASLETGIDTIRMKVIQFSSTVSFTGGPKIVMLDEADGMTTASQQSLRGVIEEFPNVRFIFTCNFKNKMIEALHSRCVVVDFKIPKEESQNIQMKFFKRLIEILGKENIEYDKPTVAALVKRNFPDFRKTLNEIQRYSVGGKIDSGILIDANSSNFDELLKTLRDKNFTEMRKWVGSNSDIEPHLIFNMLYESSSTKLRPECLPEIILILADYTYKASMVIDPQIIVAACLTEFMMKAAWQ